MTVADLVAIEEQYGAHNYHPLDVVITRGEGVWVWDVDGRRYLDCLAAYSAVNQGHCNPRILEAFLQQAHRVTLTSRAFRNDQLPRLYEKLHTLTGMDIESQAENFNSALAGGALIVADDPHTLSRRYLYPQTGFVEPSERPIMVITPEVAEQLLATAGSSLADLDRRIEPRRRRGSNDKYRHFCPPQDFAPDEH